MPKPGTIMEGTINHIELREARLVSGFTSEYVCLQAGITKTLLVHYENGIGRVNFHVLESIAKVYDMQAEDFLTPSSMIMLARIERALYKYTETLDLENNHIAALGWFDRLSPLVQIRHDREMAQHEEEVLRLQLELEKQKKETAAMELKASEARTRGELPSPGIHEDGGDGKGTELEPVQKSELIPIQQSEPREGEEE